jgi:hypothetical protein
VTRRKGNPGWSSGRPAKVAPAAPSEFDLEMKKLGLTPETCLSSLPLRRWCQANRNRCYIPEWLLKEWNLLVDDEAS